VTVRSGCMFRKYRHFHITPACPRAADGTLSAPERASARRSNFAGHRASQRLGLSAFRCCGSPSRALEPSHLDKQTPFLKARGNPLCHCVRVIKQKSEMGSLLCPLGAGRPSGPFQLHTDAHAVRSRLCSAILRGRTAHVQPAFVSSPETQKQIMNFQDQEYLISEPWWVTITGCVTLAALIAFALIAS